MVDTGAVTGTRRGVVPRLLFLLLLGGVVLSGCSLGSGFVYLKSSRDKTYLKVPESWKVYDTEFFLRAGNFSPAEETAARETSWFVSFDADPDPSFQQIGSQDANYPWGAARVLPIASDEADTFSLATLRNYVDPNTDQLIEEKQAELLGYVPVTLEGGFRGIQMRLRVNNEDGSSATIEQIVLVDQATEKVYLLVIGCRSACFEQFHKDIERVVNSWTVRD